MKVTLVAVTKNKSPELILTLPKKIKIIAENKIQEADLKFKQLQKLSDRTFEKHFIGHLQTNKVSKAIQIFDVIQSIDSIKILQKVNKSCSNNNKTMKILLQVNISNDSKKSGFTVSEALELTKNIKNFNNIELIGLMTILKNNIPQTEILKNYNDMNLLFQQINNHILKSCPLKFLSMGMSDDYELAIKSGSNMIRIGRALFDPNKAEKIYCLI